MSLFPPGTWLGSLGNPTTYDIEFPIGLGSFTTDANGNTVPTTLETITLTARIAPLKLKGTQNALVREIFDGVDLNSTLVRGALADPDNPSFPEELRSQLRPSGTITYNGKSGRIEIYILGISGYGIENVIGERFYGKISYL